MTAMTRSSARTNLSDRGVSGTIRGTGPRSTPGGTEPVTYREGAMAEASRQHTADRTRGDALVADQIAYYRARAGEYDQSMRELGRYLSMGGSVAGRPGEEDEQEIATLLEALEGIRPFETVLELACGTGWWTQWLGQHAPHRTAADAAGEELAPHREGGNAANVHHVLADAFPWKPGRRDALGVFALLR